MKYPTPGKVKTRLAKTVGDQKAAQLYSDLAGSNFLTLTSLQSKKIETWITFDPAEKAQEIRKWLDNADHYLLQEGKGLGERLSNAFKAAFENSPKSVLALGSDTLGLHQDVVVQAVEMLETQYDVVLGPAQDGGYYLIGMKKPYTLFERIEWSTSKVLESTLEKIKSLNLTYFLLPELKDLDQEEDLTEMHSQLS